MNIQGNRDFKGDASVNRADSVTDRITAEVLDVKPNNTLVLRPASAFAQMRSSGIYHDRHLPRRGHYPRQHRTQHQCFDLAFQKNNTGVVRDTTKSGFIPKLLDFIDPF